MTRGAAANAILDAGRSKKRFSTLPLSPLSVRCPPRSRLPLLSFSHSFSLFSSRFSSATLSGAAPSLFLSFFPIALSGRSPSFSFTSYLASLTSGPPSTPTPRVTIVVVVAPRGLPLSSLLMPRDRQMMIKKAPVRVRTTPRRPVLRPRVLHYLVPFLLSLFLSFHHR